MATTTMKAVVLDGPGPASELQIRKIPVPTPRAGWALIAVKAFGLNRSELRRLDRRAECRLIHTPCRAKGSACRASHHKVNWLGCAPRLASIQ
jgi:hypothetical protein